MSDVRMVDVGDKAKVARRARAAGEIRLSRGTIAAIREGSVPKGDVIAVATVAAIQAAKETPRLLPLCHPIPLEGVEVSFRVQDDRVECTCEVRAEWKTGVEMEALVSCATGLLTVWDLVKSLEKDERGQYPQTRIENLRVVEKRKGEA